MSHVVVPGAGTGGVPTANEVREILEEAQHQLHRTNRREDRVRKVFFGQGQVGQHRSIVRGYIHKLLGIERLSDK